MQTTDRLFAGSIPETYDRFLVPLIFETYALDLAERVARANPRDVLETAAGTGVLTRAMASKLPAQASIVATDLNQPMLDHASARLAPDGRIAWRQADALALPFEDQSFDVAACQFGVMFFPDKVQGDKEAHRVRRPGGRFIFNVWDRISENVFAQVVTEALAELFPHDPPSLHGTNAAWPSRCREESAKIWRRQALPRLRWRRWTARAGPPHPAMSRLPIARVRRGGTRSRCATQRAWEELRKKQKKC